MIRPIDIDRSSSGMQVPADNRTAVLVGLAV